MSASAPLEVFCCYAREDQEMLEDLKKHLTALQRQNRIVVWSDTNLHAGVEWKTELHQRLESADIILLLISADFIASDYCYGTEMKRAIERHDQGNAHVVPILLRSVNWQDTPFAKLQVIPTNAKPVKNWLDSDEAYHNVAEHIGRVVSALEQQRRVIKQPKIVPETPPAPHPPSAVKSATEGLAQKEQHIAAQTTPGSFRLLRTLDDQRQGWIRHVVWSPDGTRLALGSYGHSTAGLCGTIKIWDAHAGKLLHTFTAHKYDIHSLAWSPDSTCLASVGGEPLIKIWDTSTGNLQHTFKAHSSKFFERNSSSYYVAWSQDSTCLASANLNDKTIKLWDVNTGNVLQTITCHTKSIHCVAWSPDETCFAVACEGGLIKIWDAHSGLILQTFTGHTHLVYALAWSPDNTHLASASYKDKTIKLWNANTGHLQTLSGYIDGIRCLAWSPDNKLLASGHEHTTVISDGGDGGGIIHVGTDELTIRLWDATTREPLQTLSGHSNTVESIAWSPDGTCFASGSNDGSIKIWSSALR